MKFGILDVETTIFQHGSVYSDCNKLCYVGLYDGESFSLFDIEYSSRPYAEQLQQIQAILDSWDVVVAFNAKFDISWARRYGLDLAKLHCVDLQLLEFIITGQERPFPSLDDTCKRCGIAGKSDDLDSRYWSQNIDTTEIPEQELREYLEGDLRAEWELFQWQLKYLEDKPLLKRLCWDACQDLLVTAEMEWNGLLFDFDLAAKLGDECAETIAKIDRRLPALVSQPVGNFNSGDWVSCVLYGGTCKLDIEEEFEFQYSEGRVATKKRKAKFPITFPRLVEPLKGTELKKKGFWEVNEGVLLKLKAKGAAKEIIELLLERNKLDKQLGTYYRGWPRIYEEMQWTNGIIHGQLNHARTKTGRLSSSKPNQQNVDPLLKQCLKTRFPITGMVSK